jgi:hypothetical protein
MKPPIAYIPGSGAVARWWARFLEPPSWASSLFAWSSSGAFAAGVVMVLVYLAQHGGLARMGLLSSLGVTALSIVILIGLFLPFLLSAGLYFLLVRSRTPTSGALWCAGFHTVAHILVVKFLGSDIGVHALVPLAIGGMWGLWLPRAGNPEMFT